MSDSNQNVETTSNSKLEFTELKDLFIKRMQKWIFSGRDHFRLWAFASTGEYFHYWYWRVLPKVLQGKWCQDLQDSYNHHRFVLTNHMYTGLFQKKSKQGAWGYTFLTPLSLPSTPLASLEFLDLSLYP